MRTTDFNALPELAALLKAGGWIICKYEAINTESAVLTISRREEPMEGGLRTASVKN